MSSDTDDQSSSRGILEGLPSASATDVEALRRARGVGLEPAQLRQLLEAMPQLSYEELARRPILDGEPFRL